MRTFNNVVESQSASDFKNITPQLLPLNLHHMNSVSSIRFTLSRSWKYIRFFLNALGFSVWKGGRLFRTYALRYAIRSSVMAWRSLSSGLFRIESPPNRTDR
jgi:hypothetical protein